MIQKILPIAFALLILGCISPSPPASPLDETQLRAIVLPSIQSYCETLSWNITDLNCPGCRSDPNTQYTEPLFQLQSSMEGTNYRVTAEQQEMADFNSFSIDINFLVSEKGEILEVQTPPLQCKNDFRLLGISSAIKILEDCQGYSSIPEQDRNQSYSQCVYDISDENLAKLRLFDNVYGKKFCTFNYREMKKQSHDCQDLFFGQPGLELVWSFEYKYVGVLLNNAQLELWKKNGTYYLLTSSGHGAIPPLGSVYELMEFNPDNEAVLRR